MNALYFCNRERSKTCVSSSTASATAVDIMTPHLHPLRTYWMLAAPSATRQVVQYTECPVSSLQHFKLIILFTSTMSRHIENGTTTSPTTSVSTHHLFSPLTHTHTKHQIEVVPSCSRQCGHTFASWPPQMARSTVGTTIPLSTLSRTSSCRA